MEVKGGHTEAQILQPDVIVWVLNQMNSYRDKKRNMDDSPDLRKL